MFVLSVGLQNVLSYFFFRFFSETLLLLNANKLKRNICRRSQPKEAAGRRGKGGEAKLKNIYIYLTILFVCLCRN